MSRYSVTLIAVVVMLVFGVFFGIELATRGMERVQGPIGGYAPQGTASQQTPPGQAAQGGQTASGGVKAQGVAQPAGSQGGGQTATQPQPQTTAPQPQPVKPQPQPIAADSGINRVGNQIGDMLQTVAHGTIRTVVSLLDSIVN
ncbi:DUF3679 domain-containing protein [Paenibacillus flagellatus]|nr:DUF3679 domain-containing protein [Paenibacillus flagellatus]